MPQSIQGATALRRRLSLWVWIAVLLAAFLCHRAYRSPHYNFDVLYYVANALDNGQSERALHEQTYRLAAASLPAEKFSDLIGATGIEPHLRRAHHTDSAAFGITRRLFTQRFAYVWAIRQMHLAGWNPFRASVAINALATFATILVMIWWLSRYLPPWTLAVGLVPFAYLLQLVDTARLSTSDMLACMFCLAGLYLLFESRRCTIGAFALLALAILARAEVVILGGMAALWLVVSTRRQARTTWPALIAGGALLLGAYGFLALAYPGYSWRMAVSYCLFDHPPIPRLVDFSTAEYARLLLRQATVVLGTPTMLLWLAAWSLAVTMAWRDERLRPMRNLLLVVGGNLVARFMIFPALDYRYYLVFVVTTAVAGLQVFGIVRFAAGPRPLNPPSRIALA